MPRRAKNEKPATGTQLSDPETVAALDELSFWSSPAGLLLLENVPLRAGIRALDVGCACGFPILELAQRLGAGAMVSGIDLWQAALDRAAKKAAAINVRNIELTNGSAEKMQWEDDWFDLIVSNLGLNNFENPKKVIQECYRVAKSGAMIALTSNVQGHMREFYGAMEESLARFDSSRAIVRMKENVDRRFTAERARQLLAEAGFRVGRELDREIKMRYANGTAFLGHSFIQRAFGQAWRAIPTPAVSEIVWADIERRLNTLATGAGELVMTVPFVYIEAGK